MRKWWIIQGTVRYTTERSETFGDVKTTILVPTFFLDPHVQGITNHSEAVQVARSIINPTGNDDLEVSVTATETTDIHTPIGANSNVDSRKASQDGL